MSDRADPLCGRESEPPYDRPPLSKEYLRGEASREDGYVNPVEWYEENGVELRTSTGVALVLTVSLVVAVSLLWRRTHPLTAVAVAFGTLIAFDVARILAVDGTALSSIAALLVLPYALFRWGSGREAVIGLGVILAWLVITHVADPTGAGEMVADYGFFLSSAAFGAAIRFQATVRVRDVEQARLRQRN